VISNETHNSYFLENGLYGCRDGYDFISASIFEPSVSLSHLFELTNKKPYPTLLLHSSWLYPSGFKLMYWLATSKNYHVNELSNINHTNLLQWKQFLITRLHAHFAIDPELQKMELSKDAQEDSKKFEIAMEKIVGKDKKKIN